MIAGYVRRPTDRQDADRSDRAVREPLPTGRSHPSAPPPGYSSARGGRSGRTGTATLSVAVVPVALLQSTLPSTVPGSRLPAIGLLLAALVVSILLYAERPAIRRHTVIAFVPWMVAGSALSAFSTLVSYPGALAPLVGAPWSYLSTYVVVGTAWFAMLQFSPGRDVTAHLSSYVGSMGVGAAIALLAFVFLNAGAVAIPRLAWLFIAPVVAVFAAPAVLVLIGFWYIDAPAHVGIVGALVVFAQVLDALSTVVRVGLFDGAHTTLSRWLLAAAIRLRAEFAVDVDPVLLWTGGFLWLKLLLACAVVVALTPVTRARPSVGYLLLALVVALGLTSGMSGLLVVATGGSP